MANEFDPYKEEPTKVVYVEKPVEKTDKTDALAGGVAGGALGAAAGWGLGTLGVLAAAAVGVAAAPVIVPLAVVGGLVYGAVKGGKKLFD